MAASSSPRARTPKAAATSTATKSTSVSACTADSARKPARTKQSSQAALDDAVYQFDEMYRDKHALTRVAQKFLATHDNTYSNGMKAPAPDADFHRL
jgi:hypothetical protein